MLAVKLAARLAGLNGKESVLSSHCFLRENIGFVHPSFPVARSRCFPQAVRQQYLGADCLKAISASHSLGQLHQTVQTFSVSSGVPVGEVVENGVPVVLYCQCEGHKSIKDFWGDLFEPGKVLLQGGFFCWGFVDAVKSFFEAIGGFQLGKVLQPGFKNQHLTFFQVVRASEQKEPIVHQGSALFVGQALSYLLADSFQTSRKQFQNMELVYNQLGIWQGFMCCIVVTGPHVSAHNGDALLCGGGQVVQIADNGCLGPISKQINNVMVMDIGDNTTVLMQQIQLVNAQVEQLVIWKARLNGSSELTEEGTDRAFHQASFISDAHKGSSQCFLLDVGDQAIGHEMAFVHGWHWLEEGTATSTTEKTIALNSDPNALSSNGQVHEQLRLSLVAMQLVMTAMGTLKRRGYQPHLEVKIMCMLIHDKNAKAIQPQEVQGHLSHCRILPKKFSFVVMFPVASEGRLLRASCCYPTHFRDVEIVCRSVKNGAIPRGIAISHYFKRAERFKRRLTIDMMCKAIGYSERTLKGYISKKYRHHFLHADGTGGYTVNGLNKVSKAEFVGWHRQTVKVSRAPMPPSVIEKEVEYYYRLEANSAEMWVIVVGVIVAGIWWKNI